MIQANELSQAKIAKHFSVSLPFVEKLWHRFRTTGNYGAKPFAGGVKRLLKDDADLLRKIVKEQSDITLAELCERVSKATDKPRVTTATMCVELQRLKLPLKKSRFTLTSGKANEFRSDATNIERK